MIENLDNNHYNKAGLTEIKIALHLPYIHNNNNFERCNGTVEINGITYNYVERKVDNDTLILHCIPNNTIDQVKLACTEYNRSVSDTPFSPKGQKSNDAVWLLKILECTGCIAGSYAFHNSSCIIRRAAYKQVSDKIGNDRFARSPEQPPDAV